MNSSLQNTRHTRTLHIDFSACLSNDNVFKSNLVPSIIDTIEDLRQALKKTLHSNDARPFLRASEKATSMLRVLNDSGLIGTVIKLRAHFRSEIMLNDFSLRRNIARLEAIGSMLIEALKGQGMAA